MQIARAARWAGAGGAVHCQAVPSPQPCRLPGPRGLASAPASPLSLHSGPRPCPERSGTQRKPGARSLCWATHRCKDLVMSWQAACHFSTRPCSFYFNPQRTCETGRAGLVIPSLWMKNGGSGRPKRLPRHTQQAVPSCGPVTPPM